MCDPFLMHYRQPMKQLLDYHLRITFVPPIIIHKALRHIPYRDVLHSNVHVVLVLIRGGEFDEPLILPKRQTSRKSNETNARYERAQVWIKLTFDSACKFLTSF